MSIFYPSKLSIKPWLAITKATILAATLPLASHADTATYKELEKARKAYEQARDLALNNEKKRREGLQEATQTRDTGLEALFRRHAEAAERYVNESVAVTTAAERRIAELDRQIKELGSKLQRLTWKKQKRLSELSVEQTTWEKKTKPDTQERTAALQKLEEATKRFVDAVDESRATADQIEALEDERSKTVSGAEAALAKLESEAPSYRALQEAEAALSQAFWDKKRALPQLADVIAYQDKLAEVTTAYIATLYRTQPPAVMSVSARADDKPYYEAKWVSDPNGKGAAVAHLEGLEKALAQIAAERAAIKAILGPAEKKLNEYRQASADARLKEGDLLYWIAIAERDAIIASGVVEAVGVILSAGLSSAGSAASAANSATTASRTVATSYSSLVLEKVKQAGVAIATNDATGAVVQKTVADVALNDGATVAAMINFARGKPWLAEYDNGLAKQYDPNASITVGSLLDTKENIVVGDTIEFGQDRSMDFTWRLLKIDGKLVDFAADSMSELAIAVPTTAAKAVVQSLFDVRIASMGRTAAEEGSLAAIKSAAFLQALPYVHALRQRVQDLDELEAVIRSITADGTGARKLDVTRHTSLTADELRAGPMIEVDVTFNQPLQFAPAIESPHASFPKATMIDGDPKRWTVRAPVTIFEGDTVPLEISLNKRGIELPYEELDSNPATPLVVEGPEEPTWIGYEVGIDRHHYFGAPPPQPTTCAPISNASAGNQASSGNQGEGSVVIEAGIIDVMGETEDFTCTLFDSVNAGILKVTTQGDLLEFSVLQTYPFPDRKAALKQGNIEGMELTGPRWHLPLSETITMQRVTRNSPDGFTGTDTLWPDDGSGLYEAQVSLSATFYCNTRTQDVMRPVSIPINGTLRAYHEVPDNGMGSGTSMLSGEGSLRLVFPPIPELENKEMTNIVGNPVFGMEICGTDPATRSARGPVWKFTATPESASGNDDVTTLAAHKATHANTVRSAASGFATMSVADIMDASLSASKATLYTQERQVVFFNWLADTIGQHPINAPMVTTWRRDQTAMLNMFRDQVTQAEERRDAFLAGQD